MLKRPKQKHSAAQRRRLAKEKLIHEIVAKSHETRDTPEKRRKANQLQAATRRTKIRQKRLAKLIRESVMQDEREASHTD